MPDRLPLGVARVVMVWGPPRSGTTWLFNVVNSCLESAGIPTAQGHEGQRLDGPDAARAAVVKSHRPGDPELLNAFSAVAHVRALAIVRDPADAFQSLLRTQSASRSELLDWLKADIASLDSVSAHLPLLRVMREEWIADRAPAVVAAIARNLELRLPAHVTDRIAGDLARESVAVKIAELAKQNDWRGEFDEFDPQTHWHSNHLAPDDYLRQPLSPVEEFELAKMRVIVDHLASEVSILSSEAKAEGHAIDAPSLSTLELFALAREGKRLRDTDDESVSVVAKISSLLRRRRSRVSVSS